jgi:hypothetical protein
MVRVNPERERSTRQQQCGGNFSSNDENIATTGLYDGYDRDE